MISFDLQLQKKINDSTEEKQNNHEMNCVTAILTCLIFIPSMDAIANSGNANLKTSTTTTTKNPVS